MKTTVEIRPRPQIVKMDTENIMCEVSLKYSVNQEVYEQLEELPACITPEEAVKILRMHVFDMGEMAHREFFYVLLLNNSKKCMGWSLISKGGSTSTIVEPSQVMRVAILSGANSMILAHNHPSGYLKESKADIMLTKRLSEVAKLLGVPIIDHLILVPDGGFISFRQKNLV